MNVAALGSHEEDGMPHVSFVTLAPQERGTAILLLSDLARHTANIKRNKRVSVLVMANQNGTLAKSMSSAEDPLAEERITVHGTINLCPIHQFEDSKSSFIKRHPASAQYIDFQDFNLYQFSPSKIFLVGGFGRIETLSADILSRN